MPNPSLFTCVTRYDFGQNRQIQLNKRHSDIFSKYKSENSVLHDFAAIMMHHMPANLLSFLADEDLEGLFIYLFDVFNGRKRKKVHMVLDSLNEKPFFVGNFSLASIVTDDRPFLYDSVWSYFQEIEYKNLFILHPIFNVERDKAGRITKIKETSAGSKNESLFMIFMENTEDEKLKAIGSDLMGVYESVMTSVDDFHKMTELMHNLATEFRETSPDVHRFIHWLLQDNFVFQAARVIDFNLTDNSVNHTNLGIYGNLEKLITPEDVREFTDGSRLNFVEGYPLVADKSLIKSRMKARRHLNRFIFVDRHEKYVRVVKVLGLFTYKGIKCPPHEIPVIREKVKDTLDHFSFVQGSHDYKWVRSLIDDFPKVELFNFSRKLLVEMLELILSMQGTNQLRICYRDFRPLNNLFFFIAMPSEKYSSELIIQLTDYLKSFFGAEMLDISIREDEHRRYYLHFHMFVKDIAVLDKVDDAALKNGILSMMRTWETNLYDILRDRLDAADIDRVYAKYSERFTETYKSRNTPEASFIDISVLESLKEVKARVYSENGRAVLKIYSPVRFLLTQLMPVLDNIGLKVYEEDTYKLSFQEGDRYINSVYLADIENTEEFVDMYKENLPQLMVHVLNRTVENDRLNSLAVSRSLSYRQICLLRTLRNFLRQIDNSFTLFTLTNALVNNPEISRLFVSFFEEKFNPDSKNAHPDSLIGEITESIDKVSSVIEDKALRCYLQILGGIVRTNYFRLPERNYISIKIKSREMAIIPEPRPLFEIFVHSAQMDGVHLRGGKVARGGLRFSDRLDDYRTEVLGLVKTQMVKNAVIVPVGSKGGFIVKERSRDRAADRDNVIAQYKNYIRGLLDVTDNMKGLKVVHPDRVRIYDEKDPYLVVAADKGTATFSDIANSVSLETGFWLGDAFASGGSAGYDHKKVGITAKGAWECVKRHFRERGKDIQTEEFTVFGIGDMAGDVFGNGMLLSEKILLQAAFNHLHIFIDPTPNAEKSFKERKRLFKLATQATWADYDRSIISEGGGIFERSAKKIDLNPQIRAMLETDKEYATGEELIHLILKMKAELMWNGGIGTYVRSSHETNAQVGDPANDSLRISAAELRAVAVGEGGNLGFTQSARIEYASLGGLINTDALDNSAGVDMSDHEVNLKIMFSQLIKDGQMKDTAERNSYIKKLTSQVEQLVLEDNFMQSGCISMAQIGYETNPVVYREFAIFMRDKGLLDFRIEKIEFAMSEKSPTRPELCVLLAYSKIFLYGQIESALDINNPAVKREYMSYYPADMQAKYGDKLYDHILMREIAATVIVNRLINQAGTVFFYEMFKNNSIGFDRLVGSYLFAEELTGVCGIRDELFKLGAKADAAAVYRALTEIEKTLKVAIPWVTDAGRAAQLVEHKDRFNEIVRMIPSHMSKDLKANYTAMTEYFTDNRIPAALAKEVSGIRYAKAAFDIFEICLRTDRPIKDVIQAYFNADTAFSITGLTTAMKSLKIKTEWERVNMESLLVRIKDIQKRLAVVSCCGSKGFLEKLAERETTFFENYNSFLLSVKNGDVDSLVPFNVIIDMFSVLIGRSENI